MAKECIKTVNICGVLLTGLKSIELFQSYIDKTGDVQTIALAVIHTQYTSDEFKQIQYWMDR